VPGTMLRDTVKAGSPRKAGLLAQPVASTIAN